MKELVQREGQADAGSGAGGRRLSRRERKQIAWQGRSCTNCGVALQGPFCHVCGQPERSPMREISALTNDAIEYVLDVDARVWKTLRDLIFRPGRLTEAYLAGKRMSFVRPLRLYLVASALLFLVVGMEADLSGAIDINADTSSSGPVTAEVMAAGAELGRATARVAEAKDEAERARLQEEVDQAAKALEAAIEKEKSAPADGAGAAAKSKPEREPITMTFNENPWHRQDNPLVFAAMPDWFNEVVNDYLAIIQHNLELVRSDPKRLGESFLQVLPQSLFVLLPIFALLLKLVFVFKRRLYLEHLMVALHSHTFIYFAIVLALTLQWIDGGWPQGWPNPFGFLFALTVAWIPINLFLTQKRVYRQGWFGAIVAYSVIGLMYTVLFALVAIGALVASLVYL